MHSKEPRKVILISDGTGETAALMVKAAMVQFGEQQEVVLTRYKNIRNEIQLQAIIEEARNEDAMIAYTVVTHSLRDALAKLTREKQIAAVDLLGPLLAGLATHFGHEPIMAAGILHGVNENYFRRIEAMEYTIAHDDGRDLTNLDQADLIILGVSRTSKTPLSMYLSHQGWKVANIPLIQGFDVPKEVYDLDPRKVVALMIDPETLTQIRRARLERLGQKQGGAYANNDKVNEEIEWASEIFRRNRKWPVFNVTGKALEETAAEIVRLMASRRLVPKHAMQT